MSDDKLTTIDPTVIEKLIIKGDLSGLSPDQKVAYYQKVCQVVGLNPATQPFAFLDMRDGKGGTKQILYALRNATDQLCNVHKISTNITAREILNDSFCVTCRATKINGQSTDALGAVPLTKKKWRNKEFAGIEPLVGEDRTNAMMKAETKAKRRAVLSLVGLSFLDETEVETIRGAKFSGPVAGLPAGQDDIDDTKICDKGKGAMGEPETKKEAIPEKGIEGGEDSPAPQKDKPYWTNVFKGRTYIHARFGKTYSEEFLQGLGMKMNKKGTAYSKAHDDATEEALKERYMNEQYEGLTEQEINNLRQGFVNMGLAGDDVSEVISAEIGKSADPKSWSREDFQKLRDFQGDNYPG